MLKLSAISRVYSAGEDVVAIKDLSLQIKAGEFVAITGPSGCGKSTLLHILGLLDVPDKGEYEIDSKPTARMSRLERAQLRNQMFGFVFHSSNLLPRTSAYDNVLLPLVYRRGDDRSTKVHDALQSVGLWERASSPPNQLSGGQQQRVAIARSLVGTPQVILADEPTGNLDTKTGLEIMDIFERIHRTGTTIIMVTHNEELIAYADRIIKMRDGSIISDQKQKGKK